jgi:alpha-tectorin
MCLVSGDPHYTTFDAQILHFMGTCKYNLVTPTVSSLPQFEILGKNELRDGIAHGSFLQYAEIVVGENVARLDRYKKVYVNGVQYYPYSVVGPFTIENNGVYVRVVATLVDSISEKELEVVVESDGEWITIIKLPPEYKTNVKGLCGNFNGIKDDDLTTCDGTDVTDEEHKYSLIGSSCQVDDPSDPECTNPTVDPPTCTEDEVHEITDKCDFILGPIFEGCSSLNLDNHHDSCTFDVCVTKNKTAACSSLEALAVQCASSGSSVSWREATDCPLPCESPLVYLASASACPATCRQPNAAKVCHLPDKETCACPAETPILYKGKCISGDKCPCFTSEGSEVKIGSTWYNSDCTRKYTCEMCETCTTPELTSESQSCSTGQVCEETDGQYGCFDLPDCDQCKLVQNELGYLPDLENSRAYYQCVLLADSSWDVTRRWCPTCTVWNQDLPACDWIPELLPTGCSSEEVNITETTWIYSDGSCRKGSFHAKKHTESVCQYEQNVHGTWVVGSCAPGTAFNLVTCGCIHSPECKAAPSAGKCLTFDDGWNKLGFSGIWIGWSYDGRSSWGSFITAPGFKNNAGVFEKHILEIPAFSYNAWKDFQISFRFKQNARTSGRQGVISNGDCVSAPSLLIALTDAGEVTVQLRPSGQNAADPGDLTSLTSIYKYETGAWHYVVVQYYHQMLSLTVNNVLQRQIYLDVIPGEAWIRHRCPLRIGASTDRTTGEIEYFNGLLDEICFNLEL